MWAEGQLRELFTDGIGGGDDLTKYMMFSSVQGWLQQGEVTRSIDD